MEMQAAEMAQALDCPCFLPTLAMLGDDAMSMRWEFERGERERREARQGPGQKQQPKAETGVYGRGQLDGGEKGEDALLSGS
jgi:hypothetical protein